MSVDWDCIESDFSNLINVGGDLGI